MSINNHRFTVTRLDVGFFACFFVLPILVFVGGCKHNPLGTIKATGTVTLDGRSAEGITVIFVPVGEGRDASGVTNSHGRFALTATGAEFGTGAVPGEYVPTFSKTMVEGSDLSPEEFDRKYRGGTPPTIYLIPQRYASSSTSGFETVKVEKGKKNEFAFALESK